MSEFLMPSLGADMESAVLMEWMVKDGDEVKKGQVIAEVETSKGVIEIEVFQDGVVEKILVEPETECKVGTPLALIRSKGEEKVVVKKEIVDKEPISEQRIKISPAARKRAEELGIGLDALADTVNGVIQLSDVEDATKVITKASTADTTNSTKPENSANLVKSDGMRQAIAAAMSRSNTEIPHYYLSTSINMSPALDWLENLNSKHSINERILPAALLIRAIVKALKEVPQLNGFYKENSHMISEEINPGIAIALRSGGLITPALLNAQDMNLDETMKNLGELITRTRSGKLRGSEMMEQTVTITNLGDLGVERVYGVIYPPQVAIIGLGRITNSPWAEGDTLAVRKIMQATLAGDHRATDGRTGALFLDKLDRLLQKPEELL